MPFGRKTLAVLCGILCWSALARGADAVKPGPVELYPTYTAVGLEAAYDSDDNQNAAASFVWRKQGDAKWRNGVDMTFDRKRRLVWASIWPLEQGEAIEVEITFRDKDAPSLKPVQAQTTTRKMNLTPAGGREFFVGPAGDDSNPGTRDKPFKTLGHAAKQVQPGDIVYALSGTYVEGDLFGRLKGTAEKPIVFRAAPDQKPILDSSRGLAKGSTDWQDVGEGVWAATVEFEPREFGYVAQDGLRVFRQASLSDLQSNKGKVNRAWYYDAAARKLYVRTGTKRTAKEHTYNLSRHDYAIYLDGGQHVIVRGFEMRHYGAAAVRLSGGARGCVLYENNIHNCPGAVFLKNDTTQDNAIWRNEIHEPGLPDFPWQAVKESAYPRQGIYCVAGRGTSICYNRIHGWFDGVCPESWKNPEKLELNRDCDVMFNELYNDSDDAIEADGGGVNMRIHGNRIRNCLTAISLAPVERGPVYVTRNDATFWGLMFKLNVNGCTSLGWAYCYHNSGYCQTLGDDGGTAISFPPTIPCTNKVFKNNVIVSNEWSVRAGMDKRNYVLDGNCYFHVPGKPPRRFQWEKKVYPTLDAFRKATGQEVQGLYADPRFASSPDVGKLPAPKELSTACLADQPLALDTKIGDLRLRAGSPCIDRGIVIRGVNDNHRGKRPDVGAFEAD